MEVKMKKLLLVLTVVLSPFSLIPQTYAQSDPKVVINSPDRFGDFCGAFEISGGIKATHIPTVSSNDFYQAARNFIISNLDLKEAGRALRRLENAEESVRNLEIELSISDPYYGLTESSCPDGMYPYHPCPIGSCEFISGVNCESRDYSSDQLRLLTALTNLADKLISEVKAAANTPAKKIKARRIINNIPEIKSVAYNIRTTYGVAYLCKK